MNVTTKIISALAIISFTIAIVFIIASTTIASQQPTGFLIEDTVLEEETFCCQVEEKNCYAINNQDCSVCKEHCT